MDATIRLADRSRRISIKPEGLEEMRRRVLEAAVREPQDTDASHVPQREWGARLRALARGRPKAYAAITALGVIVAAMVLAIGSLIPGPVDSPTPALGAPLARLVESSPHTVLALPGWRIEAAEQERGIRGFIQFGRTDLAPRSYLDGRVEIRTGPRGILSWRLRKRDASTDLPPMPGQKPLGMVAALGEPARVFVSDASSRLAGEGSQATFTALWRHGGRQLTFRSRAPGLRAFEHRLAALRQVPRAAWLAALPKRVSAVGARVLVHIADVQPDVVVLCEGPLGRSLREREPRTLVAIYKAQCGQYF